MERYRFLFLYILIFGLSYNGLLSGGVGIPLVDFLLIFIFFLFTYVSVFSLKIYNFKENEIMIPVVVISSVIYFLRVSYFLAFLYTIILLYLIFGRKIIGFYEPTKSVFLNFYNNSQKIDTIIIILFLLIFCYIRFLL